MECILISSAISLSNPIFGSIQDDKYTKKAPQFPEVLFLSEKRDSSPDKTSAGRELATPTLARSEI